MRRLLAGLLFVVACSGTTEPKSKAGDPSILVTNNLGVYTYITWKDGQGIVGRDSVAGHITQCVRFLAQPDSAYWEASATEAVGGNPESTGTIRNPAVGFFNPADRPAWTLVVSDDGYGNVRLLENEVATAC